MEFIKVIYKKKKALETEIFYLFILFKLKKNFICQKMMTELAPSSILLILKCIVLNIFFV